MGVTAQQLTKQELRAARIEAQQQQQAMDMQRNAHKILTKARAHIHTKMNRRRRRLAAKKAGVFKYRGLWQGIHNPAERELLEAKTYRKEPASA